MCYFKKDVTTLQCTPSKTEKSWKNTNVLHVFIDLLSFEVSFTLIGVLFYFLSFPQLSSSLQTNIARRTNNLSLAEMSFSLLRPIMFFGIWNNAASLHSCARASPNVIIVATIIYQCQLGWGVSNWWIKNIVFPHIYATPNHAILNWVQKNSS